VTFEQLFLEFFRRQISLKLDGDLLRFTAPQGMMTADLLEQLKIHKQTFIDFYRSLAPTVSASFPLSHNQQSLWFIQQILPDSSGYNIGFAVKIVSTMDVGALNRAVDALAMRHAVLRTTFSLLTKAGTMPCQHIHESLPPGFSHVQCFGATNAEIQTLVQNEYKKPFDLVKGPMLRAMLVTQAPAEHVLLLVMHHISCDGWASAAFIADLGTLYQIECGIKTEPLRMVEKEYSAFVAEQMAMVESESGQQHLEYWMQKLDKAPFRLELRTDKVRPAFERYEGETLPFPIMSADYAGVKARAQAMSVSPVTFLLAVFQSQLMKESGQFEVVTGIATAGESRKRWDLAVGNYMNPIAIRSIADESMLFSHFCRAVHQTVLEGLNHQDYPFSLLVSKIEPPRDPGRHPIFQSFFNVLPHQMLGPALEFLYPYDDTVVKQWGGMAVKPLGLEQQAGNFDLSMELADTGTMYYGVLKYRTDLFERKHIDQICNSFLANVCAFSDNPALPLGVVAEKRSDVMAEKEETKTAIVSATFTAEPLYDTLNYWFVLLRWRVKIEFTPFNQVFQQLLDSASAFNNNSDGFNICLVRFDDWMGERGATAGYETAFACLQKNVQDFIAAVTRAGQGNAAQLIVVICKPAPALYADARCHSELESLRDTIVRSLSSMQQCLTIGWDTLEKLYPVENYYEQLGEKLGHIPFTDEWFASVGTMIVRTMGRKLQRPFKVIVVDCDNTLWNGVLGEDGIAGIMIDEHRQELQSMLVRCVDAGMLLCLCSKNAEADVFEVIAKHPAMLIRLNHLAGYRINWEPKSRNILSLAQSLKLGLDDFIFIDDSPIECGEVATNLPVVLTIRIPPDSAGAVRLLRHIWPIDGAPATTEDRGRTEMYRAESMRNDFHGAVQDYAQFIAGLDLKITLQPASDKDIARISQLTIRTNQFNVSTIRRDEAAIRQLISNPDVVCFVVSVKDRFGDYGLVGMCIAGVELSRLVVDSFMLSCRAMGRGVEHQMFSHLGQVACEKGLAQISIRCIPTPKNSPAQAFLTEVGKNFQIPDERELHFEIPAAEASSVTFHPEKAAVVPDTKSSRVEQSDSINASYTRVGQQAVIRIAESMNESGQIHKAVRLFKASHSKDFSSANISHTIDAGITTTQATLQTIWQEVLSINSVGIQANFFDVGGTSLQMPAVAIQIKRRLGIIVGLVDLFQHATIAQLAAFLDSQNKNPASTAADVSVGAERQRSSLNTQRERIAAARSRLNSPQETA
jgi:FkbH-like protein